MSSWLLPFPARSPLSVVRPWLVLPLPCRSHSSSPPALSTADTVLADLVLGNPHVTKVVLKKGKAQLFRNGHPMVYSGAVDCVVGRPPKSGDAVVVTDGAKQPIAWGVYNSVSMFRVRIMQLADEVTRDTSYFLDLPKLLRARITSAVQLRQLLGFPGASTTVYRLVNSEGDRLSGLVVDMLGDTAVVSSSAAWIEQQRSTIEMVIRTVAQTTDVTWRSSANLLKEDGLDVAEIENGQSLQDGETTTVEVLENGIRFKAAPAGQKTGFYADQRDSRLLFRSLCRGKTVLDLCCYSGGFALNAAVGGATNVIGVDSSPPALSLAEENALMNQIDRSCICFIKADVGEYLKSAVREGRCWDAVVLDPPKLAPSRTVNTRFHFRGSMLWTQTTDGDIYFLAGSGESAGQISQSKCLGYASDQAWRSLDDLLLLRSHDSERVVFVHATGGCILGRQEIEGAALCGSFCRSYARPMLPRGRLSHQRVALRQLSRVILHETESVI